MPENMRRYLLFSDRLGAASWLNIVEGFFSKMAKQMLRGIRIKSKAELTDRIYLYFDEINAEPVVFHWKYNLDDINVSEEVIVDTLPNKLPRSKPRGIRPSSA